MKQFNELKPTDVTAERTSSPLPHSQGYHVKCSRCDAITVFDVSIDAVRVMCPWCNHRLTLPATVKAKCPSCGAVCEYRHTLAGHSTACASCDRPMMIDAVDGRAQARARARGRRRSRRSRSHRTLAVSEGAARSWILLAAAIATLIFVVATNMR